MASKKFPEDITNGKVDSFLSLLADLWLAGASVNINVATHELRITPPVSAEIYDRILEHFEMLELWLSGVCDNCKQWVMIRTEAYWGSHPHYCPLCLNRAINHFNEKEKWPPVVWREEEDDEA